VSARVAVVVVSFESREEVLACLDSVARHAGCPVETVVVDNASSDRTAEAVRERHPEVRILANAVNVGFAGACNQGLAASSAPFVLFLNPDAELEAGALPTLLARLSARPDLGVVAPRIRRPDGTVEVSTGRDLTPLSEWRQRRLVRGAARGDATALAEAAARHSVEHEPDWVSGAALLARRAALEAVAGFDAGFFLYEEDADLCRRLREAGWRVAFTPDADVRHRRGASMSRAASRARLEYHRSHLRYYARHNAPPARIALRLLLLGRALVGLPASVLRRGSSAPAEARGLLRLALRGR